VRLATAIATLLQSLERVDDVLELQEARRMLENTARSTRASARHGRTPHLSHCMTLEADILEKLHELVEAKLA